MGFSLIGPARDTDDLVNEPGTGEVWRDNPRARRFSERERRRPTGRSTMWAGPVSASHPPEPVAEVEDGVTIAQDGVGDGR